MNQINEIISFESGGQIIIGSLINRTESDFNQLVQCCTHFASQGSICEILPKIHFKDSLYKHYFGDLIGTKYENKCPDFKVDGRFYEFESFGENIGKQTLSNMLHRGLKQSSRIVIRDEGSSINHILKLINLRKKDGTAIEEVWILSNDNSITKVY